MSNNQVFQQQKKHHFKWATS